MTSTSDFPDDPDDWTFQLRLSLCLGMSLIAAASLIMELLPMRAFDVMLTPGIAYLVVSCAAFAIGAAGVYAARMPVRDTAHLARVLPPASLAFALASDCREVARRARKRRCDPSRLNP